MVCDEKLTIYVVDFILKWQASMIVVSAVGQKQKNQFIVFVVDLCCPRNGFDWKQNIHS